MQLVNSAGTLTIECKYRIDLYTTKEFRCNAAKRCCGSECCNDDGLDTIFIGVGVALFILVAILAACWYWYKKRQKKIGVPHSDKHQLTANMVTAASNDAVIEIKPLDDGKLVMTKPSMIHAFARPIIPPPNSKLVATTAGIHDRQPLLGDNAMD